MLEGVRTLRSAIMALACVPLLVASWVNFGRGVGLDQDGQTILDVIPVLRSGEYRPSRTSGFPLYEYTAALLDNLTALKALSLLITAATLLLMALLVRPWDGWLRLLSWCTYALLPGTIANATAVIEAPMLALWLTVLLWCLMRTQMRWALILPAMLAVLTRPDAALLVLATAAAYALFRRRRRAALPLTVGVAIAAVVILALNRGGVETGLLLESLIRTAARAAVSLGTITNVVGLVGLVLVVAGLVFWKGPKDSDEDFYRRWLLLVLAVVALRFLMLPDELDYLIGAVVVLVVLLPQVARTGLARIGAYVLLAGMATTSLVTLALFQRTDPWAPNPSFAPSLNPGGVLQDVQARRAETIRNSEAYRAYFAQAPGALLLPEDMWYQIYAPRFAAGLAQYSELVGCEGLTSRSEPPGWRLSQPAGTFYDVDQFLRGDPLSCRVVATNGPDGWIIANTGAP